MKARGVAALILVIALPWAGSPADARARQSPVQIAATPDVVHVTGLPCSSSGEFTVSMTNTGAQPVFAEMTLSATSPVSLSRSAFVSYLPATDPDQLVSAVVQARVPRDADAGSHEVVLEVEGRSLSMPVEVDPIPVRGPGDNLALGEQAFASSTHGNVRLCGGVDGNADSAQWGASGTHDASSGVFPDTYGVELHEPRTVGRVELYTLDSEQYPAAEMGIRDFDLQVRVAGAWQTVSEFTGNTEGHVTVTFPAVEADQVQVITHDSNDHKYSRIVELEVYGPSTGSGRE